MVGLRRVAYFKSQRLIGSRTESRYKQFLDLEAASTGRLETFRARKLETLLNHAALEVPFYRARVARGRALDLSDFPIVTKNDLRRHFEGFMTPALREAHRARGGRWRIYDWVSVKTGGTTGMPVTVIHDAAFRDQGRASRLYSQALCGFPFGTPYVRLWGSMRDVNEMRDSWTQVAVRRLAGETLLNAFRMTPERMQTYLDRLDELRARYMMGYADALDELARYAERKGRQVRPLVAIMACAATLTEETRSTLRRVFGARVHNKYGSRECTDMACECEYGGFHVYAHHVHMEVVDAAGRPCSAGRRGRILVTLLGNHSFPLIRYEIGDVGGWGQKNCPCGRPFPQLESIEGRVGEFLTSARGNHVSPVFIRHLLGVVHNPGLVRRFQLVQEGPARFVLRVEIETGHRWEEFDRTLRDVIVRDLAAVLGPGASIEVLEVRGWGAGAGKHLYTENRIGQFA
jgi:phenylacetate-CoA ligase